MAPNPIDFAFQADAKHAFAKNVMHGTLESLPHSTFLWKLYIVALLLFSEYKQRVALIFLHDKAATIHCMFLALRSGGKTNYEF